MPRKRPPLVNGEIYHVVVRGVGDIDIFRDIDDYYRGIFSLYEFNTTKGVVIREQRKRRIRVKALERQVIKGLSSDDRYQKITNKRRYSTIFSMNIYNVGKISITFVLSHHPSFRPLALHWPAADLAKAGNALDNRPCPCYDYNS